MVFGTFDGLHKGHVNFLKQAKNLSEKSVLIVSIARDRNVFKIKGAYPRKKERERMMLIKKSGLADKVILSGIKNHLPHIIKEHPDVIALGYDQTAYVTNLKKDFKIKKLNVKIVRLKPYQEKIYKNSLLKKKN
jgi:FAD synthetase